MDTVLEIPRDYNIEKEKIMSSNKQPKSQIKNFLKYKAEVVMTDGSKYEIVSFPWVCTIQPKEFLLRNMIASMEYIYASDNETLLNVSHIVSLRFILSESRILEVDRDELYEKTDGQMVYLDGTMVLDDELFKRFGEIPTVN